jgi:glycosyltransferase involved in cell wall biosynthesis
MPHGGRRNSRRRSGHALGQDVHSGEASTVGAGILKRFEPGPRSAANVEDLNVGHELGPGLVENGGKQFLAHRSIAWIACRPRPSASAGGLVTAVYASDPCGLDVVARVHFSGVRVTILTHYYPPEVGAPQARLSTLARLLRERGVEVTVHTGFPHYPDGRVKAPYRNRPWLEERLDGVRVVRSLVLPAPNRGFARRVANHLSLAGSAVATARRAGPADVVLAETPPLFTAAAAVAYARLAGARLVLNVSDRWPASAVELGALADARAIAAAERLERWCYRRAAAIAVPTDGLRAALEGVSEASGRVHRLGPAVDTSRFAAEPPAAEPGRPLRVLYAGTLGLAQNVATLVDAAALAGGEVEVWIAGDGADGPALRDRLAREPAGNVRLLGVAPHGEMPRLYAETDVAAVLLRDRPIFTGALPTKMFEAMASARPVVVSAPGEAADLVEAGGAGVAVAPEDPRALADALLGLARDRARVGALGAAARRCAEAYDWDLVAGGWYDLLSEVRS